MRRTGLPNMHTSSGAGGVDDDKGGSGRGNHGSKTNGRSHTFEYHEHEMAELQLHTVYSFNESDKGKNQWCRMDTNGERQFYSTHMLITKMRRDTEYPILVFYEKIINDLHDDISTTGIPTAKMEVERRRNRRRQGKMGVNDNGKNSGENRKMNRMTGSGGDTAISSGTFGIDATTSKSDLVNAVLKIDLKEAGSMSFDTASLVNDVTWLENIKLTESKIKEEERSRKYGTSSLEGFATEKDGREQCCEIS